MSLSFTRFPSLSFSLTLSLQRVFHSQWMLSMNSLKISILFSIRLFSTSLWMSDLYCCFYSFFFLLSFVLCPSALVWCVSLLAVSHFARRETREAREAREVIPDDSCIAEPCGWVFCFVQMQHDSTTDPARIAAGAFAVHACRYVALHKLAGVRCS